MGLLFGCLIKIIGGIKLTEEVKNDVLTEHRANVRDRRSKKSNFWMFVSLVLAVLVVALFFNNGGSEGLSGKAVETKDKTDTTAISKDVAAKKALNLINNVILQGQATAKLVSSKKDGNFYVLSLDISGNSLESYVTLDGKLLFPQAIDLTQDITKVAPPVKPKTKVSVDATGEPYLGKKDAPVTIVVFDDFECPYCARFETGAWPSIKKNYIDTGKVKFVYMNFPLGFHKNAQKAAEASECAFKFDSTKFWKYKETLFKNQQALDVKSLKKYAKDLGFDSTKFDACLDNNDMKTEVEADFKAGTGYGVSGTPAFFVNGQLLEGALPFSSFKSVIEDELNKTKTA